MTTEQQSSLENGFRTGNWWVKPRAGELRAKKPFFFRRNEVKNTSRHVEPKAMRVLLALAYRQGEFASKDALIEDVWDGRPVSDDVLTGAIHAIRAAMDDDPRDPKFIETRSNVGYRLLTSVRPVAQYQQRPKFLAAAITAGLLLVVSALALINYRSTDTPQTLTTIAVLPFMNNSESPGANYLSDAMTEALILNLSRLPDIRVISRTSVLPYAEHRSSAASIARQLGADLLVEGSVQMADGQLRVVAQLIEPFEDVHLWADHFDRPFDDVLALQHEVSGTIASQIGGVVLELPVATPVALPSSSLEDYLQARYLLAQDDIASTESALTIFLSLGTRHPDFAPAYLGQAQSLLYLFKTRARDVKVLKPALDAGLRYESLNGRDSLSNRCIGQIVLMSQWDFDEAESRYTSAIAMNPSDTIALRRYAWLLVALQRYDEAVAHIHQIRLLNPLYYESVEMAALLMYSGQVEAALVEFERLDRTTEMSMAGFRAMAIAYLANGRDEDAHKAMVRMLQRSGHLDSGQAGDFVTASAESLYRYILEVKPFKSQIVSAGFHNLLGNTDAAVINLQQAVAQRDPFALYLGALPELASLQKDTRFQALLSEIGVLPENQDHLLETRLSSANLSNPQPDLQEN